MQLLHRQLADLEARNKLLLEANHNANLAIADIADECRGYADKLQHFQLKQAAWGPLRVPESLQPILNGVAGPDAARDLRIVLEDRRVTDLSADFWMKKARE